VSKTLVYLPMKKSTQLSGSPLPEFEKPPLVEVVFGVQVKALAALKTPHVGAFWENIGKAEYPEFEEKPPLAHVIETYNGPKADSPSIEMFETPPLPRFLFVSEDKKRLVQLQRDRFLQNWRKHGDEGQYPRYESLFPQFESSWESFSGFVRAQSLGDLQLDQYELTYVNHIEQGCGWTDEQDIDEVFPWFKCRLEDGFSDALEEVAWRRVYRFPENAGRLHVSMQQAATIPKKTPVLVLKLTARGFAESGLKGWFDLAHEHIVRTFADITGPSIQESTWKRQR